MAPFAFVHPAGDLATVSRALAESGLPQIPVVETGLIVGYVGERELARVYAREVGRDA